MTRWSRAGLPLFGALNEVWRGFRARMAAHYRPERYYMRGPGPKWQAKSGAKSGGEQQP